MNTIRREANSELDGIEQNGVKRVIRDSRTALNSEVICVMAQEVTKLKLFKIILG